MSPLQRRVGMLTLITLLINPIMLFAQPDSAVTVVGSGIPAPLIQAFASAANVNVDLNVTGTNEGFATFCQGKADLTTATRALTTDEEAACNQNNVSFLEFVLGYDIMAVIANPASNFGQCLTTDQLNALFAPSSTVTNWNAVAAGNPDIPLSLFTTPDNTTSYALLDTLVEGVGLRPDVTMLVSSADIVDRVSSTSGALGIVNLPAALAAGDKVTLLQLNKAAAGCVAPSVEAVEGRTYSGAYTLYAYANTAAKDKVAPILTAAFASDNTTIINTSGFVASSATIYTQDSQILTDNKAGRQFSKDVTAFHIPANLVGTINIAGSTTGSNYVQTVTGDFVKLYPGVTVNQDMMGESDGIGRLCKGEIDLVNAYSGLTQEQQDSCAANFIPPETFTLGNQVVVVLGHADFLTCLTKDELAKVWGATSTKTITNWNQVNASFPDQAMTLVAPPMGDVYADLLMIQTTGVSAPIRDDEAELKSDPTYRATAISNVAGGMTYMSWADYQNLAPDVAARSTLMAVDGGQGCVTPSDATITDGTYPLARPLNLIVNRISMAREEVQSLLWFIASDDNYSQIASSGFTPISFSVLPDLRDRLQRTYIQAAQDAAEAAVRAAQATPEATDQGIPPAEEATAPAGS
jgi:phosphate transport system substrate-binding protein